VRPRPRILHHAKAMRDATEPVQIGPCWAGPCPRAPALLTRFPVPRRLTRRFLFGRGRPLTANSHEPRQGAADS